MKKKKHATTEREIPLRLTPGGSQLGWVNQFIDRVVSMVGNVVNVPTEVVVQSFVARSDKDGIYRWSVQFGYYFLKELDVPENKGYSPEKASPQHDTCAQNMTTCCLARDALNLLRERKTKFDIVISDVNMPDMDGFKLLERVGLEMDLPNITKTCAVMSVDGETSRVMKGVQHGACDYLLKPVRMKELRNIWQHVLRKKIHEVKDIENQDHGSSQSSQMIKNGFDGFDGFDDELMLNGNDSNGLRKRKDMGTEEYTEQDLNNPGVVKKARIAWTVDLHQKFVDAVNQIGFDSTNFTKDDNHTQFVAYVKTLH
ncbi:Two-component response regulator Orr26 [Asimina triloba]